MKTTQYRNWLNEHGYAFHEDSYAIDVKDMLVVNKKDGGLFFYCDSIDFFDSRVYELIKNTIEYAATKDKGIEEYFIVLGGAYTGDSLYLRFCSETDTYDFSFDKTEYEETPEKTRFTKEVIKKLPYSIRSAIDCGFLALEEVWED